jgi:hypothetical protein
MEHSIKPNLSIFSSDRMSLFDFIKRTLLFIFQGILIYLIMVVLAGMILPASLFNNIKFIKGGYGHLYTRLSEADTISYADVIVVGSSHAYRGFDPRIFHSSNIRMFNLGSSAQSPVASEILLDYYIDRLKPSVVIYEVYPLTFTIDGVESAIDIISNSPSIIISTKLLSDITDLSVLNTYLFSVGRYITPFYKDFNESRIKKNDKYIMGGFVEKADEANTHSLKFENRNLIFFDKQKMAFERTLQKVRANGIKLILVQAPVSEELYSSFNNRNEIDDYFSSFEGVPYLNYNKMLSLPSREYFYDASHLNQKGVEIFNQALLNSPELNNYSFKK